MIYIAFLPHSPSQPRSPRFLPFSPSVPATSSSSQRAVIFYPFGNDSKRARKLWGFDPPVRAHFVLDSASSRFPQSPIVFHIVFVEAHVRVINMTGVEGSEEQQQESSDSRWIPERRFAIIMKFRFYVDSISPSLLLFILFFSSRCFAIVRARSSARLSREINFFLLPHSSRADSDLKLILIRYNPPRRARSAFPTSTAGRAGWVEIEKKREKSVLDLRDDITSRRKQINFWCEINVFQDKAKVSKRLWRLRRVFLSEKLSFPLQAPQGDKDNRERRGNKREQKGENLMKNNSKHKQKINKMKRKQSTGRKRKTKRNWGQSGS